MCDVCEEWASGRWWSNRRSLVAARSASALEIGAMGLGCLRIGDDLGGGARTSVRERMSCVWREGDGGAWPQLSLESTNEESV